MFNRNWNVSSEIEPRVPRHPTPALTDTVPTVPEVSLAFDTPQQINHHSNQLKSPRASASYAQWKQQVPQKPISNSSGILQNFQRSNSSAERPNNSLKIPQNHEFTKDNRLKFYQKLTSGPSASEIKIHPSINPTRTPSRGLQRSLSVGSHPQKTSELVLKPQNHLSMNSEHRIEPKTTCDCHKSENNEIINKLLSLIQSQNAQIQVLQGQVETLLSMRAERREINDYQRVQNVERNAIPHNVSTNTTDPQRLQYQNSPRKIQEFDDETCKQVIKEKKVSIGVMTSFELTVQDVYNVDNASPTDHQDQSPHSGNRTPAAGAKVPSGPLEQIIEDSESHLSSTIQASNNFHTCSSARKSLQGNLSNCVELPEINQVLGQNGVDKSLVDNNGQSEGLNGAKKIVNSKSLKPIESPQNQGKSSPRTDLVPKDSEIMKKTPKVGWTLYDNVMCQVNEILHNSEEEVQENRSKLVMNGMEQLKVFGFTYENSGCSGRSLVDNRRMAPIPVDASYYPRLDYQANVVQTSCSASDSNTSLHMKALAMKYLGSQGGNGTGQQRGMEMFTNMVLSNMQGNGSVHEVPKIDNDQRFQGPPKALPDAQRGNYLMHSKQSPHNGHNLHNILDISSLKRQPKLL